MPYEVGVTLQDWRIRHYAPINVKPHPTQYGDGWGITKGFDAKFCPEGGAFDLNKIPCIYIGNIQSQIPYLPHLSMWG